MATNIDDLRFCGYIQIMAGRPELPDGEKRDKTCRVRVNEDERAAIELAAKNAEMSMSEWARDTLLRAAEKSEQKPSASV